jgi:hypothetical protein
VSCGAQSIHAGPDAVATTRNIRETRRHVPDGIPLVARGSQGCSRVSVNGETVTHGTAQHELHEELTVGSWLFAPVLHPPIAPCLLTTPALCSVVPTCYREPTFSSRFSCLRATRCGLNVVSVSGSAESIVFSHENHQPSLSFARRFYLSGCLTSTASNSHKRGARAVG